MNRLATRYLTISSIALGLGIAGTLVANAQWSIPGQGAVQITTAAMPAGTAARAKRKGDSIVVSWDAQQIVPGVKMQQYLVTAHDTQSSPRPDVARTVAATSADAETATFTLAELGNGKWSWGIVAKYQRWSGAEGARSSPPVSVGDNRRTALLTAAAPTTKPATGISTLPIDPAPTTTSPPETPAEKPKAEPVTSAPEKTAEPEKTESRRPEPSTSTIDPTPAESAS
jgi:hypothetical protein